MSQGSQGIIDWSSDAARRVRGDLAYILALDLITRGLVWLPQKTCLPCGSKTQPCCGH